MSDNQKYQIHGLFSYVSSFICSYYPPPIDQPSVQQKVNLYRTVQEMDPMLQEEYCKEQNTFS